MISTQGGPTKWSAGKVASEMYESALQQRSRLHDVEERLAQSGPINEIELAMMLESIRKCLLKRFHNRGSDIGYFEEYLLAAPWLATRVQALLAEQLLLAAEISYIADEALSLLHPYEPASQKGLLALRLHFNNFLRRWREYEEQETELVYEALYDDIGVGD